MQAYYDEELELSNYGENFYQVNFYGNNLDCIFHNKKFNEFLINKQNDLLELKNKILMNNSSGVMIAGGEPLLQRQALINIFNFCKKKEIKTAITTNATKPKVLESLLKTNIIKLVVVKLITTKANFRKVTNAGTFFESADQIYNNILESVKILKKYDQEIEIAFVTDIVPGYVFRKEIFLEIAELIKDIKCSWTLTKFNPKENILFSNIIPPSDKFIENLKDILEKEYPKLNVIVELI